MQLLQMMRPIWYVYTLDMFSVKDNAVQYALCPEDIILLQTPTHNIAETSKGTEYSLHLFFAFIVEKNLEP